MASSTLNYPKITIQIEGKGSVKDVYETDTFNPEQITEWRDKKFLDIKGWVNVYHDLYPDLPVRKVIIKTPELDPTVELPYLTWVRVTYNDPISGLINSLKAVEGINIENYPAAYGINITSIDIMTDSTVARDVEVKVYQWEDIV